MLNTLAYALFRCGRIDAATPLAVEGLEAARETNSPIVIRWSLILIAAVILAKGDPEAGATLVGAADLLSEELSLRPYEFDRETKDKLRAALGDEAYNTAVQTGRDIRLGEAITKAVEWRPPSAHVTARA
jgi:hypothetical protein